MNTLEEALEGVLRATAAARIIVRHVRRPDNRRAALEAHMARVGADWHPTTMATALTAATGPIRDQTSRRLEHVAKDAERRGNGLTGAAATEALYGAAMAARNLLDHNFLLACGERSPHTPVK